MTAGVCGRGRTWLLGWIAAATVLSGLAGYADGFRSPPQGAAALGRGGAHMVYGDEGSAATHNPANLMDLHKAVVTPSVTIGFSETEYTDLSGASEKSDDALTVLPAVYGAWPVAGGKHRLGLALDVPHAQTSEWKEKGLFMYRSIYFAQMNTVNLSPCAATRVGKNLMLGAGVDALWSTLEFRQAFPWSPLPEGLMGPSGRQVLEGDGFGLGGHAGLTWELPGEQRVSLVYRAPVSIDYEGDFTLQNPPPPAFWPPMVTRRSDADVTLDFPSVVGLGYGIRATEALRVQAEVEWVEHSRNETIEVDVGNNNILLSGGMEPVSIPQDWDDTWTLALGLDWSATPEWTLRAGWTYLPSPIPDETFMPSLPETDRNVLAVGAGYRKGAHALDFACAYNLSDNREIAPAANPAVAGTYEASSYVAAVAYTYSY